MRIAKKARLRSDEKLVTTNVLTNFFDTLGSGWGFCRELSFHSFYRFWITERDNSESAY
jgi:hypothetical protein